jgi:hypothetical protein
MQIAVPRTSEATSVQNHLNQKPAYDQAALANSIAKHSKKMRAKSTEVDSSAFLNIKQDSGNLGRSNRGERKTTPEDADRSASPDTGHPFKGKHIDISL